MLLAWLNKTRGPEIKACKKKNKRVHPGTDKLVNY